MKKLSILIIAIVIAFNYSCKKDREVKTEITGQLRTNGTENTIKMSSELTRPVVVLYERMDQVGYTSSGYHEYAKTTVDANGYYKFEEDLKKNELYLPAVGPYTLSYRVEVLKKLLCLYENIDWKSLKLIHIDYIDIISDEDIQQVFFYWRLIAEKLNKSVFIENEIENIKLMMNRMGWKSWLKNELRA